MNYYPDKNENVCTYQEYNKSQGRLTPCGKESISKSSKGFFCHNHTEFIISNEKNAEMFAAPKEDILQLSSFLKLCSKNKRGE